MQSHSFAFKNVSIAKQMPFFLSRNSIIFQLAIQGKTFKISTGITTQNWDTKTKRIAKVEDFYFEKNNILDKIE